MPLLKEQTTANTATDNQANSPTTSVKNTGTAKTANKWKPKRKIKKWPFVLAVLAAGVLGVVFFMPKPDTSIVSLPVVPLSREDLTANITASGNVASSTKENVYTKLSYRIKTLNVEVGDRVEAGQEICVLDGQDLQEQIEQASLALSASRRSALEKIANAEIDRDNANATLEEGFNAQLLAAKDAVTKAESAVESSQRQYDDAVRLLADGQNATVLSAETAMINAQRTYEQAQLDYNKSELDYNSRESAPIKQAKANLEDARIALERAKENYKLTGARDADAAVTKAEEAVAKAESAASDSITTAKKNLDDEKIQLDNKERAYRQARTAFEAAISGVDTSITTLEEQLNSAKANLESAKANLLATENTIDQTLDQAARNVNTAIVSTDFSSEEAKIIAMRKKVNDCVIKSPVSGTITAVQGVEGALPPADGIICVIEDTQSLLVKSKIKEYNVSDIVIGQPVTITATGAGDKEYNGTITKIAPSATMVQGSSGSTDPQFAIEITVNNVDESLKIGMTTQLSIQIDHKDDVLGVKYEALSVNKDGKPVVYILENPDPKTGLYTARSIVVSTGIETDVSVEITSDELTEGMLLASDAINLTDGSKVRVTGGVEVTVPDADSNDPASSETQQTTADTTATANQ